MRIVRIVQHACARFADQISASEAEKLAEEREKAAAALGKSVQETLCCGLAFENDTAFRDTWRGGRPSPPSARETAAQAACYDAVDFEDDDDDDLFDDYSGEDDDDDLFDDGDFDKSDANNGAVDRAAHHTSNGGGDGDGDADGGNHDHSDVGDSDVPAVGARGVTGSAAAGRGDDDAVAENDDVDGADNVCEHGHAGMASWSRVSLADVVACLLYTSPSPRDRG